MQNNNQEPEVEVLTASKIASRTFRTGDKVNSINHTKGMVVEKTFGSYIVCFWIDADGEPHTELCDYEDLTLVGR